MRSPCPKRLAGPTLDHAGKTDENNVCDECRHRGAGVTIVGTRQGEDGIGLQQQGIGGLARPIHDGHGEGLGLAFIDNAQGCRFRLPQSKPWTVESHTGGYAAHSAQFQRTMIPRVGFAGRAAFPALGFTAPGIDLNAVREPAGASPEEPTGVKRTAPPLSTKRPDPKA